MRVAASSPAWLTRSAESRNCCCSLVRGLDLFEDGVSFIIASGAVSPVFGAICDALELKACLACNWNARGDIFDLEAEGRRADRKIEAILMYSIKGNPVTSRMKYNNTRPLPQKKPEVR